jgi:anti-sigma factor RsiW
MDDCRRTADRLTPYVDEALPPGERSDVERHLNQCPPCRRSAAEEQGGRTVVRECADRLRQPPLPPGLRSRCEELARHHCTAASAGIFGRRLLPALLIGSVGIVTGLVALSLSTPQSGAVLAAQLTADHVKCFGLFGSHQEVDARTVENDLEARYGWDMHVPPSSPENGLRLLGGARCLYADGTMPHIMYRAAGAAPVSLFRLEGVTSEASDVTTMGHQCRIWSRGGHTFVLVVPESASSQTVRLASYVQQEAR